MFEPTMLALPVSLFILSFGELAIDLNIVLKIFVMMTIISYITQHLGRGPLAVLLILGISWFVLFDYWKFFGGIYVLYVLVTFGAASILIDFFFVSGGQQPPQGMEQEQAEGGISHGLDFQKRNATFVHARQSVAQNMLRRRGPMG
ncbi:MAG: hypothetical protein NTZ73_01375 [Candidatus Diapherotrites archaeon]|nr:hypothetical protein [Candidatus Diapherotrites archaeon]